MPNDRLDYFDHCGGSLAPPTQVVFDDQLKVMQAWAKVSRAARVRGQVGFHFKPRLARFNGLIDRKSRHRLIYP